MQLISNDGTPESFSWKLICFPVKTRFNFRFFSSKFSSVPAMILAIDRFRVTSLEPPKFLSLTGIGGEKCIDVLQFGSPIYSELCLDTIAVRISKLWWCVTQSYDRTVEKFILIS